MRTIIWSITVFSWISGSVIFAFSLDLSTSGTFGLITILFAGLLMWLVNYD